MDAINRLSISTTEIEKFRIKATLTMHKDNLVECQESRKLELEFQLQQTSSEIMTALFLDLVK